jgi:hypothetical protein
MNVFLVNFDSLFMIWFVLDRRFSTIVRNGALRILLRLQVHRLEVKKLSIMKL